jgi:hypothetical protein
MSLHFHLTDSDTEGTQIRVMEGKQKDMETYLMYLGICLNFNYGCKILFSHIKERI